MGSLLRGARSALAFALVMLWMGVVAWPWITGLGLAGRFASPRRRLEWVSHWAFFQSRTVLALLGLGGARYQRTGTIRTDQQGLLVMNHQSVLDIPTVIVMCWPLVPSFVSRKRYTKAPTIGTGLWLADCPIIDPRHDREGAVEVLRRAAWCSRMLLIYPEGHRSPDGELQPFRTAGLLAILSERRLPVYLVATDGYGAARRLADFAFKLHHIDGRTELVGRFDPPEDATELPAFLARLEVELAAHLHRMRAGGPAPAAAEVRAGG